MLILQIEIIIHLMKYNKHPSSRPILCGISNIRWVIVGVIVGVLVGVSWLGRWAGGGPAALEPVKLRRQNTFRPCRFSTTILQGPGYDSLLDIHPAPRRARATARRQADSDNSSSPSCTLGQNDSSSTSTDNKIHPASNLTMKHRTTRYEINFKQVFTNARALQCRGCLLSLCWLVWARSWRLGQAQRARPRSRGGSVRQRQGRDVSESVNAVRN